MLYTNLSLERNLLQGNTDYAKQHSIPVKCRAQFLFLALIHALDMPSTIRALPGN